ncbi:MAG: ABC transporter ATP-binding protein [Elusimicrobiota bacterium]
MQGNEGVIVTEGIGKIYAFDDIAVDAVRGVDLVIRPGEFTAIVGPSGSGKTTLLNIISGLDSPSSGKAWLNGSLLSSMTGRQLSDFRRDNIGFIFQAYNLIPVLTVKENIEYVMMLQGVHEEVRLKRITEILGEIGMAEHIDRLPVRLSGGQQQRVAIARAMVTSPSLIFADEPTANLDSGTAASLLEMMKSLNRKTGMTFVFSTHDRMIMDMANRLITLKDGKIESDQDRSFSGRPI